MVVNLGRVNVSHGWIFVTMHFRQFSSYFGWPEAVFVAYIVATHARFEACVLASQYNSTYLWFAPAEVITS